MNSIMNVGVLVPKSTIYEWHIPNFSTYCKDVREGLCSPVFRTCNVTPIEWQLKLYPKGNSDGHKDFISLFLWYLGNEEITVAIDLSLINSDNILVNSKRGEEAKCNAVAYSRGYSRYIHRSFLTDEDNKLLLNDTLKVHCKIMFVASTVHSEMDIFNDTLFEDNSVPQYRLKEFDDFEKLLETGSHSDITFKIGEKKIKAHKAIVAGRSSVFAAMFEHEMKEKENNEIEIVDIKPEVMQELLRFIYASKVIDIEKMACYLLQAADKYSIMELKALCEKRMHETLDFTNALEYLITADMYNCAALKRKVINYIVRHQKDIVDDPDFKLFVSSQPELLCELIRAMASRNSI